MKKRIAFVLPTTLGNSGGVKIAFEYAEVLNKLGIKCDILYPICPANVKGWKFGDFKSFLKMAITFICNLFYFNFKKYKKTYPDVKIVRLWNLKDIPKVEKNYSRLIATAWDTVPYILKSDLNNAYFVQSYEIWNGPKDMVRQTYKLNKIKYITITRFLSELIKEKSVVVYNPVKKYNKFTDKKKFNDLVFGVIYRDIPYKGFETVIDLLKKNKNLRKKFCVVGHAIPKKYKKYFHFQYDGGNEQGMLDFYNKINVLIVPSNNEGFGLPFLEAMQFGIIVMSKKTGVMYDIGTKNNFWNLNIKDEVTSENITFKNVSSEVLFSNISNLLNTDTSKLMDISVEAQKTANNYIESIDIVKNAKVFVE